MDKEKEYEKCSFCGGDVHGGFINESDGVKVSICEKCLVEGVDNLIDNLKKQDLTSLDIFNIMQEIRQDGKKIFSDIKKDIKTSEEKTEVKAVLKPADIKSALDEYVIGQDEAKRVLSVATYNHYKRIGYKGDKPTDVDLEKSNILLLGPTGTGKTLLVKTLAKIVGVPVAIADATSLTENGYVGDDVESVVEKLYLASGKNPRLAERGIVYIDEIDKIAADFESSRKDVGGAGVQQALLKIIEGHKVNFVPTGEKKNPIAQTIEIDTTNILFIVGGAFAHIDYENVNHDSLREYGLLPEFLGRLPIITQTEPLTKEDMLRILIEPKNSLIRQYQAMFDMENVELVFTEKAVGAIAEEGLASATGARGLRGVIEKIMLDLAFEAPSIPNLTKAIVDYQNDRIVRRFITLKKEVS